MIDEPVSKGQPMQILTVEEEIIPQALFSKTRRQAGRQADASVAHVMNIARRNFKLTAPVGG